ncbi:MAG TPA: sulfite oxidase-like oxidoreductase [Candidatus Saccharimonadales bacterium]|nr:sulfite oxidase-like oxidoreductase [Candidatus Saccharimonadales bacterium]
MGIINKGFTGRPNSSKRLPPGQSVVERWPVMTYGPTPRVATSNWLLVIDGAVKKPVTIDWETFNKLSKTTQKTDIHCVTRWSRLGMEWEGVSLDELVALAGGLTDDAHYLITESYGGYTTNVPITDVTNDQALIATHAHGEPLTAEHGGPARLFIPHLYFWKSAKWIKRLTFTPEDQLGFWEVNGYHRYGDPWREQRYDTDQ